MLINLCPDVEFERYDAFSSVSHGYLSITGDYLVPMYILIVNFMSNCQRTIKFQNGSQGSDRRTVKDINCS